MFAPNVSAMMHVPKRSGSQVEGRHKTMNNNNNANNNHNNRQTSPVRGQGEARAAADSADTAENEDDISRRKSPDQVWAESKKVVESFLKRSLSQNAKTSVETFHPEGYHKLKRDGRLAFYQRQQSKPEQGVLTRRESAFGDLLRPATLPSRPSLNELTSEAKKKFQSEVSEDEPYQLSSSNQDVWTSSWQAEVVDKSPMIENLLMGDEIESQFHSSDSAVSVSEETSTMRRRKSFTTAITRKSVISYMEKKRQRESSGEGSSSTAVTPTRKSKTPDLTRKFSTKPHRKSSVSEPLASTWHGMTSASDPNRGEDARNSCERKPSIRERMKRILSGPPKVKKVHLKKSLEPILNLDSDQEEEKKIASPQKSTDRKSNSSNGTLSPRESNSLSSPSVLRHRGTSPRERSPSPTKNRHLPKVLRSASTKVKSLSPKPKHRNVLATSTSSEAISALSTGSLQRDKSGSLPLNVRLGVKAGEYLLSDKGRRFSEDLTTSFPPNSTTTTTSPPIHHHHHHHHPDTNGAPVRPGHLDLRTKKKSGGKLKRLFLFWKRRHPSSSSTSSSTSSGSSRSQSLPSLPAAVEQEERDAGFEVPKKTQSEGDAQLDREPLEDTVDGLPPPTMPYHHRGSLSFSSGDLDGLSLPEKQKIYDEIAQTIQRISRKYNRHIQQSRSSTPGSRIVTPDSSFSAQEYKSFLKATRSDPPPVSRPAPGSRAPVQPGTKNFRAFKDDSRPAMTTFLNLSKTRTNDPLATRKAARMPGLPARRHTRHTFTGSFDSPYNRHRVSRSRAQAPLIPANLENTAQDIPPESEAQIPVNHLPRVDVVDSPPTFASDTVEDRSAAPTDGSRRVGFVHTRERSVLSEEDVALSGFQRQFSSSGSEVDHQYYFRRRTESSCIPGVDAGASTSTTFFEETTVRPPQAQIDEDKLVQILVQVLCQKGDDYTRSIDMPPIPVDSEFRGVMTRYMADATFGRFRHFFFNFFDNVKQLVTNSPARHPEVFPIVMALNMSGLVMDIVSSDSTRQAVENVVNFSTRIFTEFCQGRSLDSVLNDLNETEEELSSVETPDSGPSSSPRRPGQGATDDELD